MITRDNKAFIDFLEEQVQKTQINDMQAAFLKSQGYSGTVDDMWFEYLGSLGFTGSLAERMFLWIQNPALVDYGTDFVLQVETTGADETFTIPCQDDGVFSASIDWGDDSVSAITAFNDSDLTHTYSEAGTHTIRISGDFPNIYFNNGGDAAKVRQVIQLGEVGWTTLEGAFYGCSGLTVFISGTCDTSGVSNFDNVLRGTSSLSSVTITTLDTSAGTSWANSFRDSGLTSFNMAHVDWSGVTSLDGTFRGSADLVTILTSGVDTSNVDNWNHTFRGLTSLALLDCTNFDTSSGTTMANTFNGTANAELDPSGWDVASVGNFSGFMNNSGMSTTVYNDLLVNWSAQSVSASETPNFGDSIYTADATTWAAREDLINTHGWTITDGGAIPQIVLSPTIDNLSPNVGDTITGTVEVRGTPTPTVAVQWRADNVDLSGETSLSLVTDEAQQGDTLNFEAVASNALGESEPVISETTAALASVDFGTDLVFTVETTTASESFTIPCNNSGTFNATIDWGDGGATSSITAYNDADLAHTYTDAGTYTIRISGDMPNIRFNNTGDKDKVREVLQMGDVSMTACDGMWRGCTGMTSFNAAPCDLTGAFNLNGMLRQCSALTTADFTGMTYAGARNLGSFARDTPLLTSITGANDLASGGLDGSADCFNNNGASDFDISGWDVTSTGLNLTNLFAGTSPGLTQDRYDAVLIAWAAQDADDNITADFGSAVYTPNSAASLARASLIADDTWTINDGGEGTAGSGSGPAEYFVDAVSGSDANDGTSEGSAWASLNNIDNSILVASSTVTVNVLAGTYDKSTDYIRIDNNATNGCRLEVDFATGCIIDGGNYSTENAIDVGHDDIDANFFGNGCIVRNVKTTTGNGLSSFGDGSTSITHFHNFDVTDCIDGMSAHGSGVTYFHDCNADDCDKSAVAHVNTTTTYHLRCSFTEKVGSGTANFVLCDGSSAYFEDCVMTPDSTQSPLEIDGATMVRCQIGTLATDVELRTSGSTATLHACYVNAYVDGDEEVTMNNCYGKVAMRSRSGGAPTIEHSVLKNLPGTRSNFLFSNFDDGSSSQFKINNNVLAGPYTFMNLDATNAGYIVAAESQFFNNLIPGSKEFDADLIAADTGGTVIVGTVASGSQIGSADTLTMADYAVGDTSTAIGAADDGNDIGFRSSAVQERVAQQSDSIFTLSTPSAPASGDWNVEAGTSDGTLVFTINSGIDLGNLAALYYQYSTDNGSTWRDLGLITPGTWLVSVDSSGTAFTNGQTVSNIRVRAVNALGNGAQSSDTKSATTPDSENPTEGPTVTQYFGSSAVATAKAANPASGGGRSYVTAGGGLDDASIDDPSQTIYISNRPGAKSSGVSSESDPLNATAGYQAYLDAVGTSNVNIKAVWERGYTYTNSVRFKPNNAGGISQSQPLSVGAFGTGSKPRFTNVQTWGGSPRGFFLMEDLDLGDSLLVNNAMGEHLRIEGCDFQNGPASLAIQTNSIGTRLRNVTLRNNRHMDIYRADSATQWDLFDDRIQGLYVFGISTLLVEDCLFDFVAWRSGYNSDESAGPMPPSKWSHGVYHTTGNEDCTYNGCVFSRASSFGLQLRSGGDVYNSLFVDNNIVSNPSSDYSSTGVNDGNNSVYAGNVALRPSTKNATNIGARGRGIAPDNRLLMLDNVAVGNDDGYDVWLVSNGDTPLSDNTIVDGWGDVSNQNVPGSVTAPYELPADFYTQLRADHTGTRDTILRDVREHYGMTA